MNCGGERERESCLTGRIDRLDTRSGRIPFQPTAGRQRKSFHFIWESESSIHGSPPPSPRRRIRDGRGAVAARPGGPERAAPGGRRLLLDPLPIQFQFQLHGRLAGRRRAPPAAVGAVRLVQGRAPPRPPRPAHPRPAAGGRRARRAGPLRPRRPGLRLPPRRAGPAGVRPRLGLPRRRRAARPHRARPAHALLRSCGGRSDDPGGVREVEHGEIREDGVPQPLQIRALVPERLPHLLPQRQGLPHPTAQGTGPIT